MTPGVTHRTQKCLMRLRLYSRTETLLQKHFIRLMGKQIIHRTS